MLYKIIEWFVVVVVAYTTTLSIFIASLSILEMSTFVTIINFILLFFLSILIVFQKKHFGLKISNKFYFFFLLLYYFYVFLDMTVFRKYPLEKMSAVPETMTAFSFRLFVLVSLILCSDTIVQYFNLKKYLFFSFLVATLPSIIYINYVGYEVFQSVGVEAISDEFISPLSISYINASIAVLYIFNIKKLFKSSVVGFIVAMSFFSLIAYILFTLSKRGAILWSVVNVLICSFYISKKSSKYIVFTIFLVFVLCLNIDLIIDLVSDIAPKTAKLVEITVKEGYSGSRLDLDDPKHSTYLIGLSNFTESPLIGNYFRLITDYELYKGGYPHNIFIEILMTMGLLGFIPFMLLFVKTQVRCFYYFRKGFSKNELAFLILFFAAFLQLQTTGSLLFKYDFWLFGYILCCIRKQSILKS